MLVATRIPDAFANITFEEGDAMRRTTLAHFPSPLSFCWCCRPAARTSRPPRPKRPSSAPRSPTASSTGTGTRYVGLMVAQDADGNPLWRCTGTLLSSTLFLTAGHCTEAPAAMSRSGSTLTWRHGIPDNGIHGFTGDVWRDAVHPPAIRPERLLPLRPRRRRSRRAVRDGWREYGALPELDQLDGLKTKRGKQNTMFTAVGYGLQRSTQCSSRTSCVRMVAYPTPDPDQHWLHG